MRLRIGLIVLLLLGASLAVPGRAGAVGASRAGSRSVLPVVRRTTAQLAAATPRPGFRLGSQPPRVAETGKTANPDSPDPALGPTIAATPRTAISQTSSFDGPTLEGGVFPPDTMGDVGPTQFVVMLNTRVRSYDKTTGIADGGIDMASDTFWAPAMTAVGPSGCNFSSDPHIRYDRLSGRWIADMIDVPNCDGTQSNRIMIAVSDGDTISGSTVWTFFHVDAPAGGFADYPTLGVDANALYIGTNRFSTSTGAFQNSDAYVVRKSSILGGGPIVVTSFLNLQSSTGMYTPQGVDDPYPGSTVGYFVGVDIASYGTLDLLRVTDPGGTPSLSSTMTLTVPATSSPITVPHAGNTGGTNGRLDAIDDRLFAASMSSDGHIWTAHNIQVNASGVASGSGGRDGARWYEIAPGAGSSPTLVQSGTVFDASASNPRSYWMPTVAVSGQGTLVIAGSTAGSLYHADAWYAARTSTDPAGTTDIPTLLTGTTHTYNPPGDNGAGAGARRWGDYSFTRVDPQDGQTIWTIQEYVQANDTWGVRIARLQAPGPAVPSSVSRSVSPGRSSVHVTLAGDPGIANLGWFDPGAGFADRLGVTAGCGVAVNGVTVLSPTKLDLDLDTTGATTGLCTVTTTNPDGQSASGDVLRIARYRPDAKIKAGSSRLLGNDVYNATGARQTIGLTKIQGTSALFRLALQNDGTTDERLRVKGPGSATGFAVHYFDPSGAEVTGKVVAGTYRTLILSPGGTAGLRLRVDVSPTATASAVRSWLVTAYSAHRPKKLDAVKAIVKVAAR